MISAQYSILQTIFQATIYGIIVGLVYFICRIFLLSLAVSLRTSFRDFINLNTNFIKSISASTKSITIPSTDIYTVLFIIAFAPLPSLIIYTTHDGIFRLYFLIIFCLSSILALKCGVYVDKKSRGLIIRPTNILFSFIFRISLLPFRFITIFVIKLLRKVKNRKTGKKIVQKLS